MLSNEFAQRPATGPSTGSFKDAPTTRISDVFSGSPTPYSDTEDLHNLGLLTGAELAWARSQALQLGRTISDLGQQERDFERAYDI